MDIPKLLNCSILTETPSLSLFSLPLFVYLPHFLPLLPLLSFIFDISLSCTPFLSPSSSIFLLPTLFLPTSLSSPPYLFLHPLPARMRRNLKQKEAKVNVD